MDQTLRQVGELLLGAIPTVAFLILLYFFYSVLVYKPLQAVLAARHDRTTGAIEKAKADIAAAAVAAARGKAQEQVNAAKASIEQEKAAAKASLQGESERLAAEIIRIVLRPVSLDQSPLGGGR